MANETQINKKSVGENPTAESTFELSSGQVLCGKYSVVKKMDIMTGEADLYLVEYSNVQYIAKIYRKKMAIKPEVSQKLLNIRSKYIAAIYELCEINGFPMEIIPYYKHGSLQGRKYTYEQLKKDIIPSINEGLKVLHDNSILHKVLKPSNIMLGDNLKDVVIIDFDTIAVKRTDMTSVYSAPETYQNLFLKKSDYYSLGILLYELFCGYTPYNNTEADTINRHTSAQKLSFPDDMPKDLQNLISACTYNDITNRKNKSDSNIRWTYEEVKKWCNNIKQVIPVSRPDNTKTGDMTPYKFLNKTYVEIAELTNALALNWNDGKKQLFRGILSSFFKGCNPELAEFCIDAMDEATHINGRDDIIFWKLLYKLNPNATDFYWKGQAYQGLSTLGRDILEKIWTADNSNDTYYYEILEEKLLSNYMDMKTDKKTALVNAIKVFEGRHKTAGTQRAKKKNLCLMAYILSGQKLMHIDGKEFRTIGEFTDYMKELLDESFEKFESMCHKLIDYDNNLDIQFESWLLALGKKKELDSWRENV